MLARPGLDLLHRERLTAYRTAADVSVTTDDRTPEEVVDAVLAALADVDSPGPSAGSPDQLVQ